MSCGEKFCDKIFLTDAALVFYTSLSEDANFGCSKKGFFCAIIHLNNLFTNIPFFLKLPASSIQRRDFLWYNVSKQFVHNLISLLYLKIASFRFTRRDFLCYNLLQHFTQEFQNLSFWSCPLQSMKERFFCDKIFPSAIYVRTIVIASLLKIYRVKKRFRPVLGRGRHSLMRGGEVLA